MGALKINVSDTSGQSWPLVLHQTLNQNSTGWGPGIKFLNVSDSSGKWAGIGGMASSGYANNNDLVFYTSAEARFRMNNNTFYPIGDAVYNLGGPTVRWANVYAANITATSASLNGYKVLTAKNGFMVLNRDDIGTSYNIDNLTFNGFFEVRASNEVTVSGAKPWDGYYGCVNFHEDICKMQIAGSNLYGFAIRGVQKANATLADIPWHTLLTSANYNLYSPTLTGGGASGTWGINITGSASNADTLDGYHADSFASASNAWRCGGSSGDANDHVFNGAWRTPDSFAHAPIGNGHLWTLNGDGAGNTCVQFSGTYNMSNIYYRSKWYNNGWTNWYTLLSSNNYNSYSPTLTGGGASGTWGINITGNAASASQLAHPLHMYGGNNGKPCYPCFARITVTSTYTSRPGMIILSSRDRYLCNLQIRFAGGNSTDPSTLYLHHDSGNSYHGIFAVKVQAGVWDLYYTKSQDWDDITVYQYSSSDFSISFPGGYITSMPSSYISSVPLPNRGTVNYGNSKPTHEDFAGMVYYQLI